MFCPWGTTISGKPLGLKANESNKCQIEAASIYPPSPVLHVKSCKSITLVVQAGSKEPQPNMQHSWSGGLLCMHCLGVGGMGNEEALVVQKGFFYQQKSPLSPTALNSTSTSNQKVSGTKTCKLTNDCDNVRGQCSCCVLWACLLVFCLSFNKHRKKLPIAAAHHVSLRLCSMIHRKIHRLGDKTQKKMYSYLTIDYLRASGFQAKLQSWLYKPDSFQRDTSVYLHARREKAYWPHSAQQCQVVWASGWVAA